MERVPGRIILVAVLAMYPGVGLIVPLALRWSTIPLVYANIVGTSIAAILSLGWMAFQVEAARRRHLVDWTTDLRLLDASEFEWLVGETFRREGWAVEFTGRQGAPDGNIDLRLSRDGRSKIVQCKRWGSRRVGVDEIRNFGGTLLGDGLQRGDGIFVTLSTFLPQAEAEAKKMGIALIDGAALHAKVDRARRPTPCGICGQPMLLSRSQHGWWFRCVTPGCQGKRDLGSDAGRAIELLTEPPSRLRGLKDEQSSGQLRAER